MYNRKNNDKGFTLIEVILSVVILALVVAPFLSSFIVANKTNADAKRKSEATALGQSVVEEMQAMTIEKINEVYGITSEDTDPVRVDAEGNNVKKLIVNLDNDKIPDNYNDNYEVSVELEPIENDINDKKTPVFSDVSSENAMVVMSAFYSSDSKVSNPTKRHCEFTIFYDPTDLVKPYKVSYTITVYGSTTYTSPTTTISYSAVPDIYMMYYPLSDNDEIVISNTMVAAQSVDAEGNPVKSRVFLVNQTDSTIGQPELGADNVTISGTNLSGNMVSNTLSYLQTIDPQNITLGYTNIYTNVCPDPSDSNLVTNSINYSLYKMTVNVMFDGEKKTTLTATKIVN